jgi:Uma2 family endonuclease
LLSKSTRRTDETIKRVAYSSLPSVQEYVLIEQDFVDVEVCRRSSGWVSNHYFLGDDVWFESLDFNLAVEEIYRWVENEDMAAFLQARELDD